MITIIFPTVDNKVVNIEASYKGTAQPWDDGYDKAHFIVTFSNEDGEEFTTDYYTQRGKTSMDASEAACALQCVLSDALMADYGLDDFAEEFCPGMKVSKIVETFEACKRESEAMERLGFIQHGAEISEAIDDEEYEAEGDELY